VLHFEPGQTPPVAGMWNLATYDDAMFFVANQAERFTIGNTTDGVTSNADGSLTIYIQDKPPDDSRAANWLPAPEGTFNLTMRFYSPLSPVPQNSYKLATTSGRPFRPSQTTKNVSLTPRLRMSVSTAIQNLAASRRCRPTTPECPCRRPA
jgi:hypothetical protein